MRDNPQEEVDYDDDDETRDENWVMFTKRTENPKLSWLVGECKNQGVRILQEGYSAHAPITYVHMDDEDKALAILCPIDDIPDDDERYSEYLTF